jgi:hypothetical protein
MGTGAGQIRQAIYFLDFRGKAHLRSGHPAGLQLTLKKPIIRGTVKTAALGGKLELFEP